VKAANSLDTKDTKDTEAILEIITTAVSTSKCNGFEIEEYLIRGTPSVIRNRA
jgi:hypothetical protein